MFDNSLFAMCQLTCLLLVDYGVVFNKTGQVTDSARVNAGVVF